MQPLEEIHRDPPRVRRVTAGAERTDHELLVDATGHELMLRILEDGADARDQTARRQRPRLGVLERHASARRSQQPRDEERERRLAGAVRPGHGEGLARAYREVDAGERPGLRARITE